MKALRSTPSLPLNDIPAAEAFLRDCLGFEVAFRDGGHVVMRREVVWVRLISASPDADMDDPARQLVIYIDVDDVDAFYANYRDALEALPDRHFKPPFDQPYGQREMHVIHGPFLFILGQPIEKDTA